MKIMRNNAISEICVPEPINMLKTKPSWWPLAWRCKTSIFKITEHSLHDGQILNSPNHRSDGYDVMVEILYKMKDWNWYKFFRRAMVPDFVTDHKFWKTNLIQYDEPANCVRALSLKNQEYYGSNPQKSTWLKILRYYASTSSSGYQIAGWEAANPT